MQICGCRYIWLYSYMTVVNCACGGVELHQPRRHILASCLTLAYFAR